MMNKTKISKDFAIVFGTIFFILMMICLYNNFFIYSFLFFLLFLTIVYLLIKNVNHLFSIAMIWRKFGYFIAKFISPIILYLFYSFIFVPFSLFIKIFPGFVSSKIISSLCPRFLGPLIAKKEYFFMNLKSI